MPVSLEQRLVAKPPSWNLTIDSTVVIVKGSMTIGSVMGQLVHRLDISQDFSDHALWWPKANLWLSNTKWSLDQYGVQSDARLSFTSMHKLIRLQLPDLRVLPVRADFSVTVFAAVCKLCKDLGIRHAEELSLLHLPKVTHVSNAIDRRTSPRRRRHNFNTLHRHNSMGESLANNTSTLSTVSSTTTPKLRSSDKMDPFIRHSRSVGNLSKSLNNLAVTGDDEDLARTPIKTRPSQSIKPIGLVEKSKFNGLWFDSSKSLMQQKTDENGLILLRFKYFNFYDLNPKLDAIRLNQLYEQAKWSVLSEEIDCTEEEMMTFAALQLQVQIQSSSTLPSVRPSVDISPDPDNAVDDDIDRALERLQDSLLGNTPSVKPAASSPVELSDYLRLLKPRRFIPKSFKRYWFIIRDTQLLYYASESQQRAPPIEKISLKGCEILPDVHLSSRKYLIRLMIPSMDGMTEILIRCATEEQYAKWMAAFRLASKGRSIGESSYETERESIIALLHMQRPSSANEPAKFDIQPQMFVSTKFAKKYKSKQLTERILEAHALVSNLSEIEAKLHYLKAWQALPEFGVTTFVVKFKDSNRKEEILGIAPNRLLRMTLAGETVKTWWTSRMRSWHVNWENKSVTVEFDDETIQFLPMHGVECKCIHEFIGAYIFLAMRSGRTATTSDTDDLLRQETLFQQLTAAYA